MGDGARAPSSARPVPARSPASWPGSAPSSRPLQRMKLPRKQARVLHDSLLQWEKEGVLSAQETARLLGSYEVLRFDWQRLARYSLWFAVACIVISIGAVVADEALVRLFRTLFRAPAAAKAVGLAALAAVFYWAGLRRRRNAPDRPYTSEALLLLGVLVTAGSIAFVGEAVDTGSGRFSVLLLLAALVYAALGFLFPSTLVWVFALLSLGSWLGAETGYLSGWGAYYLGMSYPVRFLLFGLVLLGFSRGMGYWPRGRGFARSTQVMGLLYTFVSLWMMSIFGNHGDMEIWREVSQLELLPWVLLFGAAAAAAIVHGLRNDDGLSLGFGMTFLWINLYTRFFEYFWNVTHKAVFFGILGLSFWWLGSRAEQIWSARGVLKWWHLMTGAPRDAADDATPGA